MDYGIDQSAQVSANEVKKILRLAALNDLDTLDTAIGYGQSETVLGNIGITNWNVITKLPSLSVSPRNTAQWVLDSVQESLARLRIPTLYGLLLHRPEDLKGIYSQSLYASLVECKKRGLIQRFGLSIYDPNELENIFPRYPVDLIQAPVNVLDNRLQASGWLNRLKNDGVEIHARSIFLQGLLLMEPSKRPAIFQNWNTVLSKWDNWLIANNISPIRACTAFVLGIKDIDRVIVGINNATQLSEILECARLDLVTFPAELRSNDPGLINPTRWRRL
tara:strand:- start:5395 stop:6225 length:831 start_codon:yes stop_codon:yes gene_type:complete